MIWKKYEKVFNVIEFLVVSIRQRPYHAEYIGSRPITEIKQRRARLVLRWGTAWEHRVLLASNNFFAFYIKIKIKYFYFYKFSYKYSFSKLKKNNLIE